MHGKQQLGRDEQRLDAAIEPCERGLQLVRRRNQYRDKVDPQLARGRFNLPAPGETRFVPNEVILDSIPTVSTPTLETIARRHSMTRMETQTFRLTGRRMHRWRLDGGGSVEAMIRGLVELLDCLALSRVHVVGVSYGGFVALELALELRDALGAGAGRHHRWQ
jgi:hypothetical protein